MPAFRMRPASDIASDQLLFTALHQLHKSYAKTLENTGFQSEYLTATGCRGHFGGMQKTAASALDKTAGQCLRGDAHSPREVSPCWRPLNAVRRSPYAPWWIHLNFASIGWHGFCSTSWNLLSLRPHRRKLGRQPAKSGECGSLQALVPSRMTNNRRRVMKLVPGSIVHSTPQSHSFRFAYDHFPKPGAWCLATGRPQA